MFCHLGDASSGACHFGDVSPRGPSFWGSLHLGDASFSRSALPAASIIFGIHNLGVLSFWRSVISGICHLRDVPFGQCLNWYLCHLGDPQCRGCVILAVCDPRDLSSLGSVISEIFSFGPSVISGICHLWAMAQGCWWSNIKGRGWGSLAWRISCLGWRRSRLGSILAGRYPARRHRIAIHIKLRPRETQ